MGKKEGRYNAKARQVKKTKVDNTESAKIKLEFGEKEYGADDANNELVLPSKKRKTKVINEKVQKTRFLSKAQRKRLEKIVDTKHKKENRAALLESLAQVQASKEELNQLIPISAVQTLGAKKLNHLYTSDQLNAVQALPSDTNEGPTKISSIAGAKKRKRLLLMDNHVPKLKKFKDPNVVGVEQSSSSDEESSVHSSQSDVEEHDTFLEKNECNMNVEESSIKEDIKILEKAAKSAKEQGKVEKPIDVDVKPDLILTKNENSRMEVTRDPKIQVARLKLPILGEEQRIVEAINENSVVIIAGETGSGKTTQVPQFLYEAGYAQSGLIGVTEPRRVATVAMATRVGQEMALSTNQVSYLMRFEGNVTPDTKIKFMTDGVLLKEVQSDFLLSKYTVLIIDEAHERSVYTDILIGLLSRIVPLRKKRGNPLRLIIMSATLRVQDFTENTRLFKHPPPVITVESRQYPVTVHFSKKTPDDYLREAYRKTVKIHTRLPDGGILIFVTGQQEVRTLVRKLKQSFPYREECKYTNLTNREVEEENMSLDSENEHSDEDDVEREMQRSIKARKKARQKRKELPKINLDDFDMPNDDGVADLVDDAEDSEGNLDSDSDNEEDSLASAISSCRQPLWVLPLYAMLPAAGQARALLPAPPGTRLAVVSTDVAETALTIPGIKYVVDTGKKKTRLYERVTGASAFRVSWASRASAAQRAGRAGRTSAGHAYRLYSSAVFQHDFEEFAKPDILNRPIDDLLLQMKCMGIDRVSNFPFPSPPDRLQLRMAEQRLSALGLLQPAARDGRRRDQEEMLKVTELGKAVSAFPVLPRFGKMLALSHQHDLLPYAVAMVSALSIQEVMSSKGESWPAVGNALLLGEPGVLLRAIGAAEFANSRGELELFCTKHGLRERAVREIRKLRCQLSSEISLNVPGVDLKIDPQMPPPSETQARLLRQLLLSGLGDQVARKVALDEVKEGEDKRKYKYAYHCGEMLEPVFLHSASILRRSIPDWLLYQEVYEAGEEANSKMIMRGVTAIEPEWLPVYVPSLCNLGDPLEEPPPRYNQQSGRVLCHLNGTFGKAGWPLPTLELDFPNRIERYKWFARFLLEGLVCDKLKKYVKVLLSPPATMVKSWAALQPRTESLCRALTAHLVGSRQELLDVWTQNPKYLLFEYQKWLPESAHNEIILMWPPIK